MRGAQDKFDFVELAAAVAADHRTSPTASIALWLSEFVGKPNASLRRSGDVCPCYRPALASAQVFVAELGPRALDGRDRRTELQSELVEIGRQFLSRFPADAHPLACLVVPVPWLHAHELRHYMDHTYQQVRLPFLRDGLMIGAFHPLSTRHSRLNSNFYSLRSEVPFFAVRHLSLADARNLRNEPAAFAIFVQRFPTAESSDDPHP